MEKKLVQQIQFIKEIDKLKYIKRKTKLFNSNRQENDAEHSWHLAVMAIILEEHANFEVDLLKVIKMLLIHDLVEIDAGDTFLFDTNKSHNNTEEELVAAKRIFNILPEKQAQNLLNTWIEFEDGETKEAKFAKTMDRLEPVLQNESNNGGTWTAYKVPYQKVYDKIKGIQLGSNLIWDYTKKIIDNMKIKKLI